jgi:hypothetical protein
MYWPLPSLSQILHLLMVDNLTETCFASFELLVFNQGRGRHLWPHCLFPNAGWPANIFHTALPAFGLCVYLGVPVNETRNPFDIYRQLSACGLV